MQLLDIISIFVVIANLVLGFFVWWKGKRKKANIWFFLLTIAVAGWIATNWLTYYFTQYKLIDLFGRLTYAFSSMIPAIFLSFIYIFFIKEKLNIINKAIIVISWLSSLILAVIGVTTTLIQKRPLIVQPHVATLDHGSAYPYFFAFFILTMSYAFYILIKQYFRSTGIEKEKIRYTLVGFGIAAVIGTMTNLVFEAFMKDLYLRSMLSLMGPWSTLIMVAAIAYIIVRYRYMDIKVAIRKGMVNFISIVIVLFLYLYLLFFAQKYFVDTYHWNSQTSIIVLVLIIALTIEPLRRFLSGLVDKVFYSKRKNSREDAKKLRFILSSSMQFDQLIKKVKTELQSFLDVPAAQFLWNNKQSGRLVNYYQEEQSISFNPTDPLFHYLLEHPDILITEEIPYMAEEASGAEQEVLRQIEQALEKLNVGLVCPVGERGELVGAFLFSPKSKKEAFTSDNVEYLSGLQVQLTGAIMNALLYKQAVERIARLK